MKKLSLLLTLFSIAGFAFGADEAVEIQSVDQRLAGVSDPVVKLFFKARLERASGDLKKAIQTAAQVVALHGDQSEWVAKSELFCAEIYVELGMLDAAEATIRQIQQLYVGMDVVEQADALQLKIETLKESAEREGKDEL